MVTSFGAVVRIWTESEDEKLRRLYKRGATRKRIAEVLGRPSEACISQRAHQLNITRPKKRKKRKSAAKVAPKPAKEAVISIGVSNRLMRIVEQLTYQKLVDMNEGVARAALALLQKHENVLDYVPGAARLLTRLGSHFPPLSGAL